MKAKATVHGAISIVNAIATGKGATLGTKQQATATAEKSAGSGIMIQSQDKTISSRLINGTIRNIVPKKILDNTRLTIQIDTDIPTGYGLKSSSAITTAVSLACARLFDIDVDDQRILLAGVDSSIQTKVSMTGAYDDACACYYGGFNVTNNLERKLIVHGDGPRNVIAAIFIPKARSRKNVKKLKTLDSAFEHAWQLARNSDYWNAMILNGLATSAVFGTGSGIISDLLDAGAIAASTSGNGPAIAAILKQGDLAGVRRVFAGTPGRIIVAKINNARARVSMV